MKIPDIWPKSWKQSLKLMMKLKSKKKCLIFKSNFLLIIGTSNINTWRTVILISFLFLNQWWTKFLKSNVKTKDKSNQIINVIDPSVTICWVIPLKVINNPKCSELIRDQLLKHLIFHILTEVLGLIVSSSNKIRALWRNLLIKNWHQQHLRMEDHILIRARQV